MRVFAFLVSALFGFGAVVPPAFAQSAVPIVIEAGDLDPCGVGVVSGLNPNGDGFLAVRAGPATRYAKRGELYNGNQVYVCGERNGWFAVIYPAGGHDCGVSSPWPVTDRYSGPCRWGWAHGRWIKWVAG